jgi:hypothetical protein
MIGPYHGSRQLSELAGVTELFDYLPIQSLNHSITQL